MDFQHFTNFVVKAAIFPGKWAKPKQPAASEARDQTPDNGEDEKRLKGPEKSVLAVILMARFDPQHLSLLDISDSVVVLTGGASGIGAALVRSLFAQNCAVVFGDLDEENGKSVVTETSPLRVTFVRTDVRSYIDNLNLFKVAWEAYGRVDHAIANAGVVEQGGWFDCACVEEIMAVKMPPPTLTLDVNLTGMIYFAHIACTFLAERNTGPDGTILRDKTLTLLSSLAGWKETPRRFLYQAAKHGILGLLRAMRLCIPDSYKGVRVNVVSPAMTETRMVTKWRDTYLGNGLPPNQPEDVARAIVGLCRAGPGTQAIWYDELEGPGLKTRPNVGGMDWDDTVKRGVVGRNIFVQAGKCYDIEEGLDRTESLWLGKEASDIVQKAQLIHSIGI
ncbi:Short-chain dehydrogenase reductase 3a [Talaromyces pinophilus]|nr:Short-chain dehydrogenase reductase 3a [Talaromyces pinophilus]